MQVSSPHDSTTCTGYIPVYPWTFLAFSVQLETDVVTLVWEDSRGCCVNIWNIIVLMLIVGIFKCLRLFRFMLSGMEPFINYISKMLMTLNALCLHDYT